MERAAAASASDTSSSSSGGLDAQALYASTSAGVVDITAQSAPGGAASGTGFVVDEQGHIGRRSPAAVRPPPPASARAT